MAFNVGSVVAHITADISDFKNKMGQVEKSANGLSTTLSKIGKIGAVAAVAAAGVGAKLVKDAIDQAAAFEQTSVAFETMIGDAEKAKKLLADIAETAKKTPFQLPELEEGAKRLLAYGVDVDKLIPTLKMLGDVTSGVGTEKMPQLILAFGQISAKGRLMGTELRQLTETGFNLAEAMGVTNAQLEEMVSQGEVSFADVEAAFQRATSEGGKFFNLMENQSQTFGGQVSNLKDSLTLLSREIGIELLPVAKELVAWAQDTLVPFLKDAVAWTKAHREEIKSFFENLWLVIKTTWSVVSAIIKLVIAIFTTLGQVIHDVISRAIDIFFAVRSVWNDVSMRIRAAVYDVMGAFNWLKNEITNAINAVIKVISGLFTAFKDTFEKVWNYAKDIASKIRKAISDAFDVKKRNSPSILDRLNQIVDATQVAFGNIEVPNFSHDISQSLRGNGLVGASTNTGINISLAGAYISDEIGARRMAEIVGDSIIKKLSQNVRF